MKENAQTSFAVVITPDFDEEGRFEDTMGVHIEEEINHNLTDEQKFNMRTVCGMLMTCIHLIETDQDFSEHIQTTFASMFADNIDEILGKEKVPSFTRSADGKVITLEFGTKTHGSA
tara:strand:- start:12344 stop:12694 length:351 start_codon:yes stop_codon:yes gene_type:complete